MISEAQYHDLFDVVTSQLLEQKGILSCERFGSINVPGISDLDVWVFYDSPIDAKSVYAVINRVQRSTSIDLDVTLIPVFLRCDLPFILPNAGHTKLQPQLPKDAQRDLAYAFITIWLPFKYRLLLLALARNHPTKYDLRILHSFRYTLDQFVHIGGLSSEDVNNFIIRTDMLRQSYIQGDAIKDGFRQICKELINTITHAFALVTVARCVTSKSNEAVRFTVDWCNTFDFKGTTFQVKPKTIFCDMFLPDGLKPFSLQMPVSWSGVLHYWYANLQLRPHLTRIKGCIPEPQTHSSWLKKQAETFAKQYVSNCQNNLQMGSMIRPFICKSTPKLAALFRSIYQRTP